VSDDRQQRLERLYREALGKKLSHDQAVQYALARVDAPSGDRPGVVGGTVRSGLQGATFGFSDELRGLWGGVKGAVGPGTVRERYEQERDQERQYLHQFEEDHPKLALGSELAGAVLPVLASYGATALTGGAVAPGAAATTGRAGQILARLGGGGRAAQEAGVVAREGAGLLGRVGQGAKTGSLVGGTYGAGKGEGDLLSQGISTAGGAAGGALFGGATNALGKLGTAALGGVVGSQIADDPLKGAGVGITAMAGFPFLARRLGPAAAEAMGKELGPTARRALQTADAAGEKQVALDLLRDKVSPASLRVRGQEAIDAGMPHAALPELTRGAPNTMTLADWVRNLPGEASTAMQEWARMRAAQVRPKLKELASTLTGRRVPRDAETIAKALEAEVATLEAPLWARLRTQRIQDPVVAAEVVRVFEGVPELSGNIVKGMRRAYEPLPGEDGIVSGRYLHKIKMELDDEVGRLVKSENTQLLRDTEAIRTRFRSVLEERLPGFAEVNAMAAQRFAQRDAARLGQRIIDAPIHELEAAVAGMSPEAVMAFREAAQAALNRYIGPRAKGATLNFRPTRDDNVLWTDPEFTQRLVLLFGDETQATRFATGLDWSRLMAQTQGRVGGGSATQPRQTKAADVARGAARISEGVGALTNPGGILSNIANIGRGSLAAAEQERVAPTVARYMTAPAQEWASGRLPQNLEGTIQALLREHMLRQGGIRAGGAGAGIGTSHLQNRP